MRREDKLFIVSCLAIGGVSLEALFFNKNFAVVRENDGIQSLTH